MNTDAAVQLGRPTVADDPSRTLRRWWTIVSVLLVVAIFAQAVFAGLMLSGVDWARSAHSLNAALLIAFTFTAGLVCVITLRRIQQGWKLGLTLLSLAVVVLLQTAVGKMSANGANLMWVHVPLGVALVGFAAQAVAHARKLSARKSGGEK
ncbi:MAG: hypothetical protein HY243_18895 [Proteobacteria bacterium]|nr:hypothetical protein [Pseudomonadota bacterium]